MTDQDSVSMQKLSLSGDDFSDSLSSMPSFGIEDSQMISSKELENFLLKDPDDVTTATKEAGTTTTPDINKSGDKNTTENQSNQPDDQKIQTASDNKVDPKKLLEDILFENGDDQKTTSGSTPQDDSDDSNKQTTEEDQQYDTLSKDLFRLGVFTPNSEDETEETLSVKTPEEFLERFTTEKKKGAINILDNFLSQFGEDRRKMFDAVFVNGVEPEEYLSTFAKIEAIGALDLTNEDNQERVLKAYYKSLNWGDDKINARISKVRDYGDLEEEAKSFQEVLANKERERLTEIENKSKEDRIRQQNKEIETQKSYKRILAEKLKKQEIDGIPLTQKDAEEVYSYFVNKPYKLQESGELISEFDKDLMELNRPENHEMKIKLGLLLKKKLDLSSVKKATITKRSDALFTLTTKNAKEKTGQKQMKSFF